MKSTWLKCLAIVAIAIAVAKVSHATTTTTTSPNSLPPGEYQLFKTCASAELKVEKLELFLGTVLTVNDTRRLDAKVHLDGVAIPAEVIRLSLDEYFFRLQTNKMGPGSTKELTVNTREPAGALSGYDLHGRPIPIGTLSCQ